LEERKFNLNGQEYTESEIYDYINQFTDSLKECGFDGYFLCMTIGEDGFSSLDMMSHQLATVLSRLMDENPDLLSHFLNLRVNKLVDKLEKGVDANLLGIVKEVKF